MNLNDVETCSIIAETMWVYIYFAYNVGLNVAGGFD